MAAGRARRAGAMRRQLAFCAQYMDERIQGGERLNTPIGYGGSALGEVVRAGANEPAEKGRSFANVTAARTNATSTTGVTRCAAHVVGVNGLGSQVGAVAAGVKKPPGEVALGARRTSEMGSSLTGPSQAFLVTIKERSAGFGTTQNGVSLTRAELQNKGTNPTPSTALVLPKAGAVVPFVKAPPRKLPSCIKLVWVKTIEGKEVRTETLLRDPQKIAAFYRERAKQVVARVGSQSARAPPAKAEPKPGAQQTGRVLERKHALSGKKIVPDGRAGPESGVVGERQPMLKLTANLPPAKKRKVGSPQIPIFEQLSISIVAYPTA